MATHPVSAPSPVSNASAALQEATETAVQSAQEARKGDHQAQRLVQKRAAAVAVSATVNISAPSTSTTLNTSGQTTGSIINTKA